MMPLRVLSVFTVLLHVAMCQSSLPTNLRRVMLDEMAAFPKDVVTGVNCTSFADLSTSSLANGPAGVAVYHHYVTRSPANCLLRAIAVPSGFVHHEIATDANTTVASWNLPDNVAAAFQTALRASAGMKTQSFHVAISESTASAQLYVGVVSPTVARSNVTAMNLAVAGSSVVGTLVPPVSCPTSAFSSPCSSGFVCPCGSTCMGNRVQQMGTDPNCHDQCGIDPITHKYGCKFVCGPPKPRCMSMYGTCTMFPTVGCSSVGPPMCSCTCASISCADQGLSASQVASVSTTLGALAAAKLNREIQAAQVSQLYEDVAPAPLNSQQLLTVANSLQSSVKQEISAANPLVRTVVGRGFTEFSQTASVTDLDYKIAKANQLASGIASIVGMTDPATVKALEWLLSFPPSSFVTDKDGNKWTYSTFIHSATTSGTDGAATFGSVLATGKGDGSATAHVFYVGTSFQLAPNLATVRHCSSSLFGLIHDCSNDVIAVPHELNLQDVLVLSDWFNVLALEELSKKMSGQSTIHV